MKKIHNESLIKSLQIILNKKVENITEDDYKKITNITFTKTNKEGQQSYLITELLNFKNLHTVSIENSKISFWDIRVLSTLNNIQTINFNHCFFEKEVQNTIFYIKKLKNLSLKNCYIEDYSIMFSKLNLNSLEIVFPYNEQTIQINSLSNLINLKFLTLEGCNIEKEEDFKNLKNLEILCLLSTQVRDLTFINEMSKLNKIYLSSKYLDNININDYKVRILTSIADLVMDDETYSKGIV